MAALSRSAAADHHAAARDFAASGFVMVEGLITPAGCDALAQRVAGAAVEGAGSRNLLDHDWCRDLAAQLCAERRLVALLPPHPVPLQCTLFAKSAQTNWLVAPHQDLSLPMMTPDADDWPGRRHKEGRWYAQPPASVLAQVAIVRLHLDACTEDGGALRVAPGTHRLGVLPAAAAAQLPAEHPCVVAQGGALVMRPLLVHASSRMARAGQRRVLHFVFGPG